MAEETKEKEKVYSEGTVNISSKEYRNLIEEICSLKVEIENRQNECNREWRRAYDAEQKIKSLEDELKKLSEENTRYRGFINSSADRKDAFTHYVASLMTYESNEEDD